MSEQPESDHGERARRAVLQRLQSLQNAGVRQLPRADAQAVAAYLQQAAEQPAAVETAPRVETETAPPSAPAADRPPAASPALAAPALQPSLFSGSGVGPAAELLGRGATMEQRRDALQVIRSEVAACTRCALANTRTQTVFGVGSPMTRLVFLGEGPGADEDRLGEPFVGAAGKLLDKMIAAMKLTRDEVYILNIVKCRPPGNRNPEPEEAEACREYLDRQLAVLQPEFICCLGSVAAKNLLDTTMSVGKLRGSVWRYGEAKVIVTYHPAYLLRAEHEKRKAWEDLKLLMREMGVA